MRPLPSSDARTSTLVPRGSVSSFAEDRDGAERKTSRADFLTSTEHSSVSRLVGGADMGRDFAGERVRGVHGQRSFPGDVGDEGDIFSEVAQAGSRLCLLVNLVHLLSVIDV